MIEGGRAYAQAGVDIEMQERALSGIKELVRSTFTPGVLSEIGSFGGLFRPDWRGVEDAVLVASADGVGTKLAVAGLAGDYSTVGRDLVNHCVNDILVQGARPLFFMDYVGAGVLEPKRMVQLVEGVAAGCKENHCALLGGETAEMPGFYRPGDYELVGFIVGIVDRAKILDGRSARNGDLLIALPSAGLHTNGFTLARKVFLEEQGLDLGANLPGDDRSLGEVLLAPHLSYLKSVGPLLGHTGLRGLAHITGGGLVDNLPRALPVGTQARVRIGSWKVPREMVLLQRWGGVEEREMHRVFNMGVGMVLVVAPEASAEILSSLSSGDTQPTVIGTIEHGDQGVLLVRSEQVLE